MTTTPAALADLKASREEIVSAFDLDEHYGPREIECLFAAIAAWNARPSDAAAVREACAKVADEVAGQCGIDLHAAHDGFTKCRASGGQREALRIAAAIRQGGLQGVEEREPKDIWVVALSLIRNDGRTITRSMSMSWRGGGTEEGAIGAAVKFAETAKPGFAVDQTISANVARKETPDA